MEERSGLTLSMARVLAQGLSQGTVAAQVLTRERGLSLTMIMAPVQGLIQGIAVAQVLTEEIG